MSISSTASERPSSRNKQFLWLAVSPGIMPVPFTSTRSACDSRSDFFFQEDWKRICDVRLMGTEWYTWWTVRLLVDDNAVDEGTGSTSVVRDE
jgi:hypothetical protein